MALRDNPITPCRLREETKELVDRYVEELKAAAPRIGTHGLGEEEFWASGLFRAAVESIRGTQIASMEAKKQYLASLFNAMQAAGHIAGWTFEGSGERHDYHVRMRDGSLTVIEAKGCLDGNNTNIFTRPANADQFIIWSLCQNIGDPRKNVWSGIHTRLLPEMITRKEQVDGLVVLDMVCGTIGRVCPKIAERTECGRVIEGKRVMPHACICSREAFQIRVTMQNRQYIRLSKSRS